MGVYFNDFFERLFLLILRRWIERWERNDRSSNRSLHGLLTCHVNILDGEN